MVATLAYRIHVASLGRMAARPTAACHSASRGYNSQEPRFFSKYYAKQYPGIYNTFIDHACGASSAAPIYFDPKTYVNLFGLTEMQIDGVIEPEIGYRVGERYQGQGYATEAACAVRDYLFRQGVHRVISAIAADNIASQRVALKNGMHREKRAEWQGRSVEIYAADRVSAEHPLSE